MVVVYGTVCRDRLHRVGFLPEPGGYVEIDDEFDGVGGEAVNTALALKLWGTNLLLGGNSTGSQDLLDGVRALGLRTDNLVIGDHFEPVCDIYVTPDGQRTMFGRGFREMGAWGQFDRLEMSAGDWFTVDSNLGTNALESVARARQGGLKIYLEDLICEDTVYDFWQSSTDWVARKGDIQFNVKWLERELPRLGKFCILSDGANGFVAGGTDHEGHFRAVRHYPPFPCPHLVDSTGAGDVFRAGMLHSINGGLSIADSLRFASAAGSLNCQALGANSNIPSKSDVHQLIAQHPGVARNYD